MAEVVLIAVNNDDIASANQAKYLLEMEGWQQVPEVESFPSYSNQHVRMWFLRTESFGKMILTNVGSKPQGRL